MTNNISALNRGSAPTIDQPEPEMSARLEGCTPGGSFLNGRVQPAAPLGSRLLAGIGKFFAAVKRTFSPSIAATAKRLQNEQTAQRGALWQRLNETLNAITAIDATPKSISDSLRQTVELLREFKAAGGNTRDAIDAIGKSVSESPRQAFAFATALRAATAALNIPDGEHPETEHLLMEIESAVNGALVGQIPDNVNEGLQRARDSLQSGKPAQQISSSIHSLFNSEVAPIKLGALPADAARQMVGATVVKALAGLESEELASLLAHTPSDDLLRLAKADRQLQKAGDADPAIGRVSEAITRERSSRPGRLLGEIKEAIYSFSFRHEPGQTDRNAFLRDVEKLGGLLKEMKAHCERHGANNPVYAGTIGNELAVLRTLLREIMGHRQFKAETLNAAQVLMLTENLHGLGLNIAHTPLSSRESGILDGLRQSYREHLSTAFSALSPTDVTPLPVVVFHGEHLSTAFAAPAEQRDATKLLRSLDELQRSAGALANAARMLGKSSNATGEREVFASALEALPEDERAALAQALSAPESNALVSAMRRGADLASAASEPDLSDRFKGIADVLQGIAKGALRQEDIGPLPAGVEASLNTGSARPGLPQSSAYVFMQTPPENLDNDTRLAIRNVFGLELPKDGLPSLNAGRLPPAATAHVAEELQRPLNDAELATESLGRHEAGAGFVKDARRLTEYWIVDPKSGGTRALIDTQDLPDEPEAFDAHILTGYEQLIELCGGNEEQAQLLSRYAHQGLLAGIEIALETLLDSPVRLPDGTCGVIRKDTSGEDVPARVHITVSMGPNGRPQLDVERRVHTATQFWAAGNTPVALSDDSFMQVRLRAELLEEGHLALIGEPTYAYYARPAANPVE